MARRCVGANHITQMDACPFIEQDGQIGGDALSQRRREWLGRSDSRNPAPARLLSSFSGDPLPTGQPALIGPITRQRAGKRHRHDPARTQFYRFLQRPFKPLWSDQGQIEIERNRWLATGLATGYHLTLHSFPVNSGNLDHRRQPIAIEQ